MEGSKESDFVFSTRLGKGSFGEVFKVQRKQDKQHYVIKQIEVKSMRPAEKKEALQEVHVLASFDSPYIVRYYDSFLDNERLNIVMELCDMDLAARLQNQHGSKLAEDQIWNYFTQIAIGLHEIHQHKVLHRDMKAANIFLKGDVLKIGDFGVAKVVTTIKQYAQTMVGTPYYLSPELCEDKPYDARSDVWALGCILYELCTLKHPFNANNQGALILKIVRGSYAPISSTYSRQLRSLLDSCLTRDARRRPDTRQLLSSTQMVQYAQAHSIEAYPRDILAAVSARPVMKPPTPTPHSKPRPSKPPNGFTPHKLQPKPMPPKPAQRAPKPAPARQPPRPSSRSSEGPPSRPSSARGRASPVVQQVVNGAPQGNRVRAGVVRKQVHVKRRPAPGAPKLEQVYQGLAQASVHRKRISYANRNAQKPVAANDADIAAVMDLPDKMPSEARPGTPGLASGARMFERGCARVMTPRPCSPREMNDTREASQAQATLKVSPRPIGAVRTGFDFGCSAVRTAQLASKSEEGELETEDDHEPEIGEVCISFNEASIFSAADFPVHVEDLSSTEDENDDSDDGEVGWRIMSDQAPAEEDADREPEETSDPHELSLPNLDGMTREELQSELNHLLDRAASLSKRKEQHTKECLEQLTQEQFDELYGYLQKNAVDDTNVSQEELNKFIFGRIGYEKVEVVSTFYQLFSIEAALEDNETLVGQTFTKMSEA